MKKDGLKRSLVEYAEEERAMAAPFYFNNPPKGCHLCGHPFSVGDLMADCQLDFGNEIWGCVCQGCFDAHGAGIGYGVGQLYRMVDKGRWLLLAGFPPDDLPT